MIIGVNALYLIPGGVGGTEIYLRNLLNALSAIDHQNVYRIFTNRETTDLTPNARNFVAVPQALNAASRPRRILWEQFRLPTRDLNVLFNPGFTAPILCGCPQVTVFHDLQHVRHPEYFKRLDLPAWQFLLWAAARRSTRLIAVSEATRGDLIEHYQRDATVIPHGVEPAFFDIERLDPQRFILCVSTLHPHKGIEGLIRAFHPFRESHPDFRLVLAGMRGFAAEQIERLAGAGIEITGWLPREQLIDLYRRAWAFVYPSTFEGFGMPVAEALAAGVPVACSDIPPLREVAGECAIYFPPGEPTLEQVCFDPVVRKTLPLSGRERARRFSWHTAAHSTLDVLTAAAQRARI